MERDVILTRGFEKKLNRLMRSKQLLSKDFAAFKKLLVENPEAGNLIPGTGGVRKIRLKSATKGKRGGFRVCYFDDPKRKELFLLCIYSKNEQVNLTPAEKKALKGFAEIVKRGK